MTTRIKFLTFNKTSFSDIEKFWLNFFIVANLIEKGLAKLNHIFTIRFFDDEIRKNLLTKIKQFITSNIPCMDIMFVFFAWCDLCSCAMAALEGINKPINKFRPGIINFENPYMIKSSASSCFDFVNTKAAFSINNTCKVSQINRLIGLWNIILRSSIVLFSHVNSFTVNGVVVNAVTNNYIGVDDECKAHAERLNEWNSLMEYAKVRTRRRKSWRKVEVLSRLKGSVSVS